MVSFKEPWAGGKWERLSPDPEGVCVLLNRRALALSGRGSGHTTSQPVNAERQEPAVGLGTAVTVVVSHGRKALTLDEEQLPFCC